MEIYKLGSKGERVAEIQKLLSLLGYDLVIDGDFGAKTERSIRSFQRKTGLVDDGQVGEKTYNALKAAQKKSSKTVETTTEKNFSELDIIKTKRLSENQYIKQIFPKTQIFIHYTAGGPSAENVIGWWSSDEPQVATAYVIDGNSGAVYECFNPDYWSFHLGVKGTRGKLDKISIGIEICAWGPLTEKDGKYYTYVNKELTSGRVAKLDKPFRGFSYYEAYSEQQLENLEKLLRNLIKQYNIPVQKSFDNSWFEFNEEVWNNSLPGIWTHVNVRKDKYDSYPDQRLLDILNKLSKEFNP